MPTAMGRAVERVRAAVRPHDDDTDAALLTRYAADRDGDAFAALVRRHGPMVLAACRRVTGDPHDADDAFQATFLVLARRAADVRPAAAVGSFLYGVARRTALDARTVARRRRERERSVGELPDRAIAPPRVPDAAAALDEELRRLPAKYREPLIACDVLGRTRAETAAAFRLPLGTLASRLNTARVLLAKRLTARGLAPVVSFAVLPVPAALAEAASNLGAGGGVPPAVESLTRGALAMTALTKLKLTAAVGLVVALAAAWPAAADPLKVPARRAAPGAPADASRILVWTEGKAVLYRPDGTAERTWEGKQVPAADMVSLSPDRKRAAIVRRGQDRQVVANMRNGGNMTYKVHESDLAVFDLDDKLTPRAVTLPGNVAYVARWSADGRTLYAEAYEYEKEDPTPQPKGTFAIDAKTLAVSKVESPKVPDGHTARLTPATAKGVVTEGPFDPAAKTFPLYIVPPTGDPVRLTGAGETGWAAASPDGKRLLLALMQGVEQDPDTRAVQMRVAFAGGPRAIGMDKLFVYDVAADARAPLAGFGDDDVPNRFVWSPDGRRLLFMNGFQSALADPTKLKAAVQVMDLDGTNRKTIHEVKAEAMYAWDWK